MMKKINFYIAALMLTVFFTGCGDEPVFTEMATNRLTVKIKGTLESDTRSYFYNTNLLDPEDPASPLEDDSVFQLPGSDSNMQVPSQFMFDIAELRLGGKKFANYRQVFKFDLAGDGSTVPFFNGTGVTLKNDDPPEGRYDTVQVYIRKMVFDNAQIYRSSGSGFVWEKEGEVLFHEKTVNGFDFNQLMVNSYWDSLRLEAADILRIFPLEVPIIGGLDYSKDDPETVLEIRFVIKNFIKKYEYPFYSDGLLKVSHYYALSDWLRDVRAGENDIGRNIHAVARAYVPSKTGRIHGVVAANHYIIAIPAGEPISDYVITDPGDAIRSDNDCDLPKPPVYPGNYIEAVLDYYLNFERYKFLWNVKVPGLCGNFTTYENQWDIYEGKVENFKIAPHIAFSTGTYELININPGNYDVYRIPYTPGDATYGRLFISGTPISIGTNIPISAGSNELVQ